MDLTSGIPVAEMALRLGAAAACGLLLGIDREARGKPAGLRTHALVAVSAALVTIVAFAMYEAARQGGGGDGAGDLDPIRVIQGIAQAIGLLAAGLIIRRRGDLEGATTAAVLWLAGALGIACGAGFYRLAGMTVLISVAVLVALRPLEAWLFRQDRGER